MLSLVVNLELGRVARLAEVVDWAMGTSIADQHQQYFASYPQLPSGRRTHLRSAKIAVLGRSK